MAEFASEVFAQPVLSPVTTAATPVTAEGGPRNIATTHPEEVNAALLEFIVK
jgi:hypothetical protein